MSSENNFDEHPYILITQCNKKFSTITLKEKSDDWEDFLDDTLEYSKSLKAWVLNNNEIKDFIYLVKNVSKNKFKKYSKDDSESERSDRRSERSERSDRKSERSDRKEKNKRGKEYTDDDEEDSDYTESDETDDEYIQKTLARRLTSESQQLEIEKDYVSDSQNEDPISTVRRMRHVYKLIKGLTKRIEALENK
jgi:hypothetical protein